MSGGRRVAPFIVVSGTEEFYLDREIEEARKSTKRQVIMLDGSKMADSELVSLCETQTLDERDRLIILDHAERIKGTKALGEYISEKLPTDLGVILLAVCRPVSVQGSPILVEKLPEIWEQAATKGITRVHKKPKPWDTNVKIDRIEAEAALLDLKLGKNVSAFLLQGLGDDLYLIRNELRKLALLVGPQGTVTSDQASRIVAVKPPAEPHQVAEAALEKNPKRAMSLVAHLYRYTNDDPSVLIVSALMRNVERLLVARSLLDEGKTKDEIASRMSMNAYRLSLSYLLWANRHSLESLKGHMAALCSLDANVKGPARSKRTLVELAVLSIAA